MEVSRNQFIFLLVLALLGICGWYFAFLINAFFVVVLVVAFIAIFLVSLFMGAIGNLFEKKIMGKLVNLQPYQCHKRVLAFEVGKIEGCKIFEKGSDDAFVEVSPEYLSRNPLNQEGYYVRYEDGYESFSPKAVFEAGYKLIDNSVTAYVTSTLYTGIKVKDLAGNGGAHHIYQVIEEPLTEDHVAGAIFAEVNFQNGPIKEFGVNGCQNEDLLAIVLHRLECFQAGDFKCRENALAITKIEEALHWLNSRTTKRIARGVEGKSIA